MYMKKYRALLAAVTLSLAAVPSCVFAADIHGVGDTGSRTEHVKAAKNTADTPAYETGDVVVTASGYEEELRRAPASITVITAEEIAQRGYTDLRQVLDHVEGVDTFGSTGRFDTANISIRGMDNEYTLIMVDGVPQHGPGIAGGMMRRFNSIANGSLPAPAQIERIEIVRGPMSTLYGSDAMGGVVNIITKKTTNNFSGSVTVGSILETTDDKKNTMKYGFNVAGPITRGKLGMQLRGSYLQHGASRYGIEDQPRTYDNWNLGARLSWTPTATDRYDLDIDRGQNMRDGLFGQAMRGQARPPFLTPPNNLVTMQGYLLGDMAQRFDRTKAVLSAENKVGRGTWTNTLSFLRNEMHLDANPTGIIRPSLAMILPFRMTGAIRNHIKNDIITFDTKYVVPMGAAHKVTLGGRWQHEGVDYEVRRRMTPTPNPLAPPQQRNFLQNMARMRSTSDVGKVSRTTWSLFGEDTWTLSDRLAFTYGLRYDHPNDYDTNLSPRGYLVYKANDYLTVKGGVATGYKAPTALQSSNVDIHLNVANQVYRGNTALKPEKSISEEIGFYYSNHHATSAHLTVFSSDFKNKIDLSPAANISGLEVRTYENIGKAHIHGLELGTEFHLARNLTAGLNWTLTTSRIKSGRDVGSPLRSTPKQAVNLKLDWVPTDETDVWLLAQYRSGMRRTNAPVPGLSENYKAFTVLNMGITHKIQKDLTVQFAVNNLLNRNFDETVTVNGQTYGQYYDTLDNNTGIGGGSYLPRRSYWIGLTYDF